MTPRKLPRRRAPGGLTGRLGLTGALVVAAACASGGGERPSTAAVVSRPDSSRVGPVNRRITAAASLDSAAGARDSTSSTYRVGPEDLIDIEVFGADTFSGSYRVDPSGEIALPLLGAVPVAAHTAREVEDALEARLAETYMHDPHVTVRVAEMRSHGVSVIGAVNRPGVYQVPGHSTLLEVLAQAEGLREDAGGTVFIVRSDIPDPALEVDLGALLESGSAEENVVVHPGDVVQVRPAGLVYVVGEVNRPGGFTIPPGQPMTVLQAVAMAQGLGSLADADESVIVREHGDGTRQELPVDLEKVLDGSETPPTLAERDVLFVPKNGAKSFALGLVDNLVRMVTFRGLVY